MAPFKQKRPLAHQKPENYVFGRPSEYRPEYADQVIEFMREHGHSLTAFAGHIGMSRETMYYWMERFADFSDAVSRARAGRTLALEDKLMEAKTSGQAACAIFALKNAAPEEFRDERNIRVEHDVNVRKLTDQQLREIIERRMKTIEHKPDEVK